ncbi:MAG: hypothetical protein ACJ76H_02835 [Bacteriovoracaceae bacterium]
MKPTKSIVLLMVSALAFGACSKKHEEVVSTAQRDITVGTGAAPATTPAPVSEQNNYNAAAVGAGAGAAGAAAVHRQPAHHNQAPQQEEYNADDDYRDDDLFNDDSTSIGTGKTSDDYEYVDETASEPNDVRGGRDPRMVPKNKSIHRTSSDPFNEKQDEYSK